MQPTLPKSRRPKRGRPARAGAAATERIELRVTRLERAAWEHAAAQAGMTLSSWIRMRCDDLGTRYPVP